MDIKIGDIIYYGDRRDRPHYHRLMVHWGKVALIHGRNVAVANADKVEVVDLSQIIGKDTARARMNEQYALDLARTVVMGVERISDAGLAHTLPVELLEALERAMNGGEAQAEAHRQTRERMREMGLSSGFDEEVEDIVAQSNMLRATRKKLMEKAPKE